MNCPNDNAVMHPVRSTTHYDQMLIVDQCSHCGGIWFDEGELFRAHNNQSKKIDAFDQDALLTSSPVLDILVCPRDSTPLHTFSDPAFPTELIIESCGSCHGIWMNRGEFSQYQDIRKTRSTPKEKTTEDVAFDKKIDVLLAPHVSQSSAMVRFAELLSTPMDRSTLQALPRASGSSEQDIVANRIANTAMNILNLFMRR